MQVVYQLHLKIGPQFVKIGREIVSCFFRSEICLELKFHVTFREILSVLGK